MGETSLTENEDNGQHALQLQTSAVDQLFGKRLPGELKSLTFARFRFPAIIVLTFCLN